MKLNAISLVNFRQHANTRVTFDAGLTGIIGANGSGKTTILEAIAWALYGNSATRGTRDSIRFLRAPARSAVRVELDFDLSGHRYRVVRGLTSAELYLDNDAAPIANSITGVSELLQRRLGMTRSEFFNTYFTGQKELNVMAAMGPSERAQFLSRVLGYEKLRTAQTMVRDRRKIIAAEIAMLRSAMPDPDAVARLIAESETREAEARARVDDAEWRRKMCGSILAELEPRWRRAQEERDKLQELLSGLRVAESEAAAHARDLERLDRELADIAGAHTELEALARELGPLAELGGEFQRLERLAREEGKRQTLVEGERALADEIVRLNERKEKVDQAPQLEAEVATLLDVRRRELEELQTTLDASRTAWARDKQEAETKRDDLRAQYAEVREQRDKIAALGEDGICPTCSQRLGKNFRTMLEQFDDQLFEIKANGTYYAKKLEEFAVMPVQVRELDERRRTMQVDVGQLERRYAKVQSAIQERTQLASDVAQKERRREGIARELAAIPTGYDLARHTELRREMDRLAPLNERATRLSAQVEREPAFSEERVRVARRAADVGDRIAGIEDRRAMIVFDEADFIELRQAHERALADARSAEISAAQAQGDSQAARAALESARVANADLARNMAKLDALTIDKRLHDELDRAYSDLRTDLNFELRPEISYIASGFLSDLTDGRYTEIELDDQYNILVLDEGVPKPVISGGEEDLANLVLRLAISQMVAERAGQSFSLLVLDEVFGSLDESRRHNVVELLRRLQDRFAQVILITHIVDLVNQGLDRVIEVRFDDATGASVVEQPDSLDDVVDAAPSLLDELEAAS